MRTRRMAMLVLSVAAVGLAATGCRTMGKATGTYDALMSGTPDKVVDAAKAALAELKINVTSANATKLDGEILAKTAQDKDITIKVKEEGTNVSRMTVKVGSLGDKTISESILDETKKRL